MNSILQIPEVRSLDERKDLVRIPDELDVPLTPRIRRLIDTASFRRLANISQLGLVSLVYPAANHTRFEHSLGVYRNALLYLKQLASQPDFAAAISTEEAEKFLLAALLHDIGHWPFCHPIEDMQLKTIAKHEDLARQFIVSDEIQTLLSTDWSTTGEQLVALLGKQIETKADRILNSMISGPVDIDKMDYLYRDSLHAGVPYGKNFDQQRLIGSYCLNERGTGIAISDKGRTAAEMMVFARYVMFSEVYWHHAVRSATAMLQRGLFLMQSQRDIIDLCRDDEAMFKQKILQWSGDTAAADLIAGLFGPKRSLFKRLAQFNFHESQELYDLIAHRPFEWLVECSERLRLILQTEFDCVIYPNEILIDAPPTKLEVEFQVDVFYPKERRFRKLSEVSPVVRTLARKQFDNHVKRVRIFAHPRIAGELKDPISVESALKKAISQ